MALTEELVCPPCNCYNIWEEEVVSDNGESGFDTTVVPPIPPPPPPPPIASESSNPTPPPTSEPPASRSYVYGLFARI